MDTNSLIAQIRQDPNLGKGSCSYIDETHSNEELRELLEEDILPRIRGEVTFDKVKSDLLKLEKLWTEVDADHSGERF